MLQKTADHPLSLNITFDFSGPMCEQILHIAKNSCVLMTSLYFLL